MNGTGLKLNCLKSVSNDRTEMPIQLHL